MDNEELETRRRRLKVLRSYKRNRSTAATREFNAQVASMQFGEQLTKVLEVLLSLIDDAQTIVYAQQQSVEQTNGPFSGQPRAQRTNDDLCVEIAVVQNILNTEAVQGVDEVVTYALIELLTTAADLSVEYSGFMECVHEATLRLTSGAPDLSPLTSSTTLSLLRNLADQTDMSVLLCYSLANIVQHCREIPEENRPPDLEHYYVSLLELLELHTHEHMGAECIDSTLVLMCELVCCSESLAYLPSFGSVLYSLWKRLPFPYLHLDGGVTAAPLLGLDAQGRTRLSSLFLEALMLLLNQRFDAVPVEMTTTIVLLLRDLLCDVVNGGSENAHPRSVIHSALSVIATYLRAVNRTDDLRASTQHAECIIALSSEGFCNVVMCILRRERTTTVESRRDHVELFIAFQLIILHDDCLSFLDNAGLLDFATVHVDTLNTVRGGPLQDAGVIAVLIFIYLCAAPDDRLRERLPHYIQNLPTALLITLQGELQTRYMCSIAAVGFERVVSFCASNRNITAHTLKGVQTAILNSIDLLRLACHRCEEKDLDERFTSIETAVKRW